ncbi:MAG: hypothetical protein ACTHOM_16160 [Allomuricauda sp.]
MPEWVDMGVDTVKEGNPIGQYRDRLQLLMQDDVGIVRNTAGLQKAIKHLDTMYNEIEELYRTTKMNVALCELRNMVHVARLIVVQCLRRKENKGGFYNIDFELVRNV